MKHKISLIIPCLNEEKGLEKILKNIPKSVGETIVIDGNSLDASVNIAKKYQAEIIIEKKRGYGQAAVTGFNKANNPIIGILDADATYPIEELDNMVSYMTDNHIDFLVACRFPLRQKSSMATKNLFGNLLFSAITSLIFDVKVTDICSGMWLMKKGVWKKIKNKIYDRKWFFSNEIKIEALLNKKIKYDEYWIELKKREGISKAGNPFYLGIWILIQLLIKRL